MQARRPKFRSPAPTKKPGKVACSSNPGAGEVATGGCLGACCPACLARSMRTRFVGRLFMKSKVKRLKGMPDIDLWLLPTHTEMGQKGREGKGVKGGEGEGRSDWLMILSRSPAAIIARLGLLVFFPPRVFVVPSPACVCSLSVDICVLPLLIIVCLLQPSSSI